MFLSCAAGHVVRTFELSSEAVAPLRAMASQSDRVTCARYNHNGRILASCAVDGGICLDVAGSGELLSRFFYPSASARDRGVTSVHFSSGSRFLASGGSDGFVRVWDLKSQEVTQTYTVSASAVTCVSFSGYKDEHIVAGSASGAISVCDVQSSETAGFLTVDPAHGVRYLYVHQVSALQASPHPYARQAVGACYTDGSVRVWDLTTGQLTSEFVRHHEAVATSLALSPVSKVLLASAGLDGRIAFFDTQQRRELRAIHLEQPISALALCADGKTLAVGTIAGEILVYDLRGAITPLYSTMALDGTAVSSLHFAPPSGDAATSVSPQGQRVVSAEHMSPVKSETVQEIALRKLQELGLSGDLSRPVSPTNVSTAQTQPVATPPPTADGNLSGGRLSTRSRSEPSLVSLAAPSPRSSITPSQSTARTPSNTELRPTSLASANHIRDGRRSSSSNPLRSEIDRLRAEIEARHRRDQEQLGNLLDVLMDRLDTLADENRRLQDENERLKAHLLSKR